MSRRHNSNSGKGNYALSYGQSAQQRTENGWVKLIRVVFYIFSISGAVVGASLIKSGNLSQAYADGTHAIKTQIGLIVFFVFLIILYLNIMWGVFRWARRGYREKWRIGSIIGKLVGGGIWRTLVFIPLVLLSAFLIAPRISDFVVSASVREEKSISLSEQYDRLKYLNDNFESLNYDDIREELGALLFSNVDFGLDASSNVSTSRNKLFFANSYAYSSTVTILNKARLSGENNFIIFYTDNGDDAITDSQADKLADMLEEVVSGYSSNLGLGYEYESLPNNDSSLAKMREVLEGSGIDTNIIDSAMPIYVVDPYKNGSNILASYAGRRFKDQGVSILMKIGALFGEETAKLYDTTPSYPFINVLPKNIASEDLPVVVAHELGHHYSAVYNQNTYGETGSDDNFIDETTPNWMAINVLPGQPSSNVINANHYNAIYLGAVSDTISEISDQGELDGYPAVAFLENYYRIVPDAESIIMDATYYGDALNYLFDHAGTENFRKVMTSLAEKNLTGDYDGKLTNLATPKGRVVLCTDVCTREYEINPASIQYSYFSAADFDNVIIKFESKENEISASLLGKKGLRDDWEIIKSGSSEIEFGINNSSVKDYEAFALAVSDYSITDVGSYTIKITKDEIKDIIADEGDFDFSKYGFSNPLSGSTPGCYEIDTDSLIDNLINLINLRTEFVDRMTKFGEDVNPDKDYSKFREEDKRTSEEITSSLSEAKTELSRYKISICGSYIGRGHSFDSVKASLRSSLGGVVNLLDERRGDDRYSVFVGFDILARVGKGYLLAQSDDNIGLITLNIAEK